MTTRYRRIALFFVLSFVFSWFGIAGNWLAPSDYWPVPIFPLGPLISAVITLLLTEGRAGFKAWFARIARFRAPARFYAISFLVPLAIIVASVGVALLLGIPHGPIAAYAPAEYLLYIPVVLLMGPLPEEVSFRGLGQHELQVAMSPLKASILVGLGVAVWHLPLFMSQSIPWIIAATLIAVSVVYAWLYNRSGSVWPLVILHFVQNYFGGELLGPMFVKSDSWVWLGVLTAFYALWAVFIVWRQGEQLGRSSPNTDSPGRHAGQQGESLSGIPVSVTRT